MGKLHKLRRQIKHNPEEWYYSYPGSSRIYVKGVWSYSGKFSSTKYGHAYKSFVRHVLREMGIDV